MKRFEMKLEYFHLVHNAGKRILFYMVIPHAKRFFCLIILFSWDVYGAIILSS